MKKTKFLFLLGLLSVISLTTIVSAEENQIQFDLKTSYSSNVKNSEIYKNTIENLNSALTKQYISDTQYDDLSKKIKKAATIDELININTEITENVPNSEGNISYSRAVSSYNWDWPFPSIGEGSFSSGQLFGVHAGNGRPNNFHDGLDFGSVDHPGTNIQAVHNGKVVFAGMYGYGLGTVVVTLSNDGYYVMYQEFGSSTSNIKVKVGQQIQTGEVIGTRNTSHVHIGVTKTPWETALGDAYNPNGVWINPQTTIRNGRQPINQIGGDVFYTTRIKNQGWTGESKNGQTSGTTGKNTPLEGVCIALKNGNISGIVQYRAHVTNKGWLDWTSNGYVAGGAGERMEALQVKLTGDMASKYSIQYRTHVQNIGWTAWVKDGATSGTTGQNKQIEALEIKLEKK